MTQNRLVAALSASALLAGSLAIPSAAHAELAVGAKAPDFTTQGALAGKAMPVNLHKLLRKGPVVLYFYPKAFKIGRAHV